jgi:hypothetical protein
MNANRTRSNRPTKLTAADRAKLSSALPINHSAPFNALRLVAALIVVAAIMVLV